MSVLDTLKAASRSTREVTLCVDSALQAEHDAALDKLNRAAEQDARDGSLAEPQPATIAAAKAMEDVRDRMEASLVTFRFVQLPWAERLMMQAQHPPRDGNIADTFSGYNVESFTPALIRACCVAVIGTDGEEVTEIPDDVWDSLLAALNYQQVNLLTTAALMVNDQETKVPPSARFLLESQDSEASLSQPDPGTSPRSGSKGGSPRGSRKSSATKRAASSE